MQQIKLPFTPGCTQNQWDVPRRIYRKRRYALDPVENLNARYTVSSGLLISTILFHVQSVMKATSHTSKLSYFDMMMLVSRHNDTCTRAMLLLSRRRHLRWTPTAPHRL